MISTYLGYQLYGNNLTQSLARTAAQPTVSQAEAYFNANIGKVKTVSDLVNNYRLLSYATKAFGLGDQTNAKALLTQVLTSDLSSSTSVANKLGDSRYTAFAKAFGFNTNGTLPAAPQLQTSAQQASTEALFKANTSLSAADAATATTAYEAAIKSITSVSQLEQNSAALGYVLIAYGIDASTASDTFEQTLESKLSGSSSFVDQQPDAGYSALSQAFDVDSTGAALSVTEAQSDANVLAATTAYTNAAGPSSANQQAAATETSYYLSKIGSITSASQLTSDSRLLAYVVSAYGLPSGTNATTVQKILTSDPANPSNFAQFLGNPSYAALAKAYTFTTSGAVGTVTQFQSLSQQQSTEQLYAARQTSDTATADDATAYYKANIGSVKTVADLEKDPKLLAYVEAAYGISSSTSNATVTSIIENSGTTVSDASNSGLLAFNRDFNVDASGQPIAPLTAQSSANITATTQAYVLAAGTSTASQQAALVATTYYKNAIANVTTVGGLLNDPKLVAYIEQAYNIPTSTPTSTLRSVLTSDLSDPKSIANTKGSSYNQLAAAFDFGTNGLLAAQTQGPQSKTQLNTINNAYVEQQLETQAAAQNPGIELALYLQVNASKITDAFSVLGDKKLITIFQTILGLPSTASAADIDSQAKTLNSQINFADLKDPKKLQNLIQRFSVLYDLHPPASTAPLTLVSVLSGGSTGQLDVTSLFAGPSGST